MTTVIPLANLNILEIQLKIRFSKDNCDLGDFFDDFWGPILGFFEKSFRNNHSI